MKALITGASSGIGRDIARALSTRGIDLILAARRTEPMIELKKELPVNVRVISCDLSVNDNAKALYEHVKDENIDILINNAGFGVFGRFTDTDLDREISMINTNITAVHILTKLFLRDMKARNSGYILNVASSAGFMPGPLFSSYYASKAYVLRLIQAINYELKKDGSSVYVGALCPGPVDTDFNRVADVKFAIPSLSSEYVAEYAAENMFGKKSIIVPGFTIQAGRVMSKILPDCALMTFAFATQKRKYGNEKQR